MLHRPLNVDVSRFLSRGMQERAVDNMFERPFLIMLEHGLHADVTLVAWGGSVKAHRCVLAAVSPVFHAMFNLKEQETSTVGLRRIRIEVLQLLLILLHLMPSLNDDASLPEFDEAVDEYFVEIFDAWLMFQFGGWLASVFASALPRKLTQANCWWFYDRVTSIPNKAGEVRIPLSSLIAVCDRYIMDNFDVISSSESFMLEMTRNPWLVRGFMIRAQAEELKRTIMNLHDL